MTICALQILITLDGQDFSVTAPYTSPTRSTCGASNDCALETSEDHQYAVTIATAGDWTFSLCGATYDTRIYVGTLLCSGDLAFNDDACGLQSEVTLTLVPGIYHVTVEGWFGNCGDYVLDIYTTAPVGPEDLCVGALNINCGDVVNGNTSTATTDTAPTCGTTDGAPGVWYTFTGTGQQITASLCGSSYDTKIRVFTGNCSALVCEVGNDDFCGTQSEVSFNSILGTTYYILVHGFGTASGAYTLSLTCATPPGPEDDCVGAQTILCGDVLTGNTSNYTTDVQPFCGTADGSGGGLWYEFTGTGDFVTASLCGSTYDTRIRVFEGNCSALVCVVGNDDFCGLQSEVSFLSVAGTSYFILVHGFGSSAGDYTISLTCGAPPTPGPEDCAGASTVCNSATFTGNSSGSGAVDDVDFSNADCLSVEHQSSWYFFQAQTAGTIAFEIVTAIDYDFAVWGPYSGTPSCSPAGLPIRCSWSAAYGSTGLQAGSGDTSEGAGGDAWLEPIIANVGDTYILCIDNFTSDNTSFDLNWNLSNGATLDCTPLPIELLRFEGYAEEGRAILEWATAGEVNNDYFSLERSRDGINFTVIGTTPGAGNSSALLEYSFIDRQAELGPNYYRLKQTDYDGTNSTSPVIVVYISPSSDNASIQLYPNPVKDGLHVIWDSRAASQGVLSIKDIAGHEILNSEEMVGHRIIDVTGLDKGVYILQLTTDFGAIVEHFIKE
ncbi:MAG: T9SS type A sorting domain-containing protein [Flavobacteriales bacterium]|nr:T9SS type A sorting domain-containing protein [Flavobacteriales bacterium]